MTDLSTLSDTELSNTAHAAWTELERRRYDVEPIQAGVRAISDNDSISDEQLVLQVLNGVRKGGWRIVRTDPVTEPDERVILLEEWGA